MWRAMQPEHPAISFLYQTELRGNQLSSALRSLGNLLVAAR